LDPGVLVVGFVDDETAILEDDITDWAGPLVVAPIVRECHVYTYPDIPLEDSPKSV
jgi:hypothetical protein